MSGSTEMSSSRDGVDSRDSKVVDSVRNVNSVSRDSAEYSYGSIDSTDQNSDVLDNSDISKNGPLARIGTSGFHLSRLEQQRHSKLFYLSLIEGRCRTQAAKLLKLPEDHPKCVTLAEQLSKELVTSGILPSDDLARPELQDLRASYLNTFDSILEKAASKQNLPTFDTLSVNNDQSPIFDEENDRTRQYLAMANAGRSHYIQKSIFSSIFTGGNSSEQLLGSTMREVYSNQSLIGKGGFGKVYKVQNRIDGQVYAVKQIVLKNKTTASGKVREQFEALVSEARILASLEHPNIVRYHHSWVESRPPGSYDDSEIEDDTSLEDSTEYGETIRFEPKPTSGSKSESELHVTFGSHGKSNALVPATKLVQTTLETDVDKFLFIKMALYPMTLEHFLWDGKEVENTLIKHCFHASITTLLLSAILDGVRYIHSNGIVHRDLKPANILLSVRKCPKSAYTGSIEISDCNDCATGLNSTRICIVPRIGDFGLVKDITDEQDCDKDKKLSELKPRKQAGTTLYLAKDTTVCPKLDVFSLGVITFEMLCKFGTQQERIVVLEKLRNETVPTDFEDHCMVSGIRKMVCSNRKERWNCEAVQEWIQELKSKHQ